MKLSAPIYQLKRRAKLLSRESKIPLHEALNRIAIKDGFRTWSHLASSYSTLSPAGRILDTLNAGDMMLLGARPGQGKTLLGMEIALLASKHGRTGLFFTLDYNESHVLERLDEFSTDYKIASNSVAIDTSDDICADYIIERLSETKHNMIAVIDYLQILDQKRSNPNLDLQMSELRQYAKAMGWIIVIISQVDRAFDLKGSRMPGLCDIRLPNPIDLNLFDKTCFLHEGEIELKLAGT